MYQLSLSRTTQTTMFKLVVLCTLLAAAAAKPDLLFPTAYTTTLVEPAKTTISQQASSVIHPSPLFYSAGYPFAHFIKKRSPGFFAPTTYIASAPLATTYSYPTSFVHTTPVVHSSSVFTTAHLIKKRSAALLAAPVLAHNTYLASTPVATTYSASYINEVPLVHTPLSYVTPAHFIKKRSAPLITSYIAPTTYASSWYPGTYAAAAPLISTPYISTYPFGYPSYFFKNAVNGVPLDTPEVVSARLAHYQAKALSGVHHLRKRSVTPLAYSSLVSPVTHGAVVSPVAPLTYSSYSPYAYSAYSAPALVSSPLAYSAVLPKAYGVHAW
ncbi:PREDICTED: uncharacterized protein LOC106104536 [Papilio polytes]|uniref:uncharacterized protein LOC106104536 n=1 Tax=Papilio polytes TaxID=76194 RepID=UPI0006765986|nr:PREDICTED: uncharacterized protein LOC106104536 [Papilio polytes]